MSKLHYMKLMNTANLAIKYPPTICKIFQFLGSPENNFIKKVEAMDVGCPHM